MRRTGMPRRGRWQKGGQGWLESCREPLARRRYRGLQRLRSRDGGQAGGAEEDRTPFSGPCETRPRSSDGCSWLGYCELRSPVDVTRRWAPAWLDVRPRPVLLRVGCVRRAGRYRRPRTARPIRTGAAGGGAGLVARERQAASERRSGSSPLAVRFWGRVGTGFREGHGECAGRAKRSRSDARLGSGARGGKDKGKASNAHASGLLPPGISMLLGCAPAQADAGILVHHGSAGRRPVLLVAVYVHESARAWW